MSSVKVSVEINDPQRENPHNGKKISKYIFSPDMKYVVTWSEDDKSIIGWTITEKLNLEFDNSINAEELEKIVFNHYIHTLIGVSNYKQIILFADPYGFEIIDISTKSRQVLNAQGLKGVIANIIFLENGELAIVKEYPVYRVYIFSKSKNPMSNNNGYARMSLIL